MLAIIKSHVIKYYEKWLLILSTGFFLFFVLFFYKGFNIQDGISDSGHGLLFRSVSFGLLTSFLFMINEFYISGFFSIQTVMRRIIWVTWEIFSGASAVFLLFNYFWNWTELHWAGYGLLLFEYSIVMVFPIIFVWMITGKYKKHRRDLKMLKFHSDTGKEHLMVRPENFLYIKSEDNYVEIHYISDSQLKNVLLRNTLSNIEHENSGNPFLLRCHRSYIINPIKIIHILNQNRKIRVDLGFSLIIPVSRKYHSGFSRWAVGVRSSRI